MTGTEDDRRQVTPNQRGNLGECEGRTDRCKVDGCPRFGTLGRPARDGFRRVKGCGDPVAIGKRSKRKGQRGQAKASGLLGMPRSSIRPGHEELAGGTVRWEHKEGKIASPVVTRFRLSEAQSDAARSTGDHRPFVATFGHDGRVLAVVDLNDLAEVVAALASQLGMEETA